MVEGEYLTGILQNQLRGPVSGILSLAQLILLEGGGNPDLREYAQSIYERGQRILTVMDNLSDLRRCEAGAFVPRREPLVVNTVAEQIVRDYDRTARHKALVLRGRIQGQSWNQAPLVTWWGQENLLWGVFENLYRNALEAAPSGTVVEWSLRLEGDQFLIEVENQGEVPHEWREGFFQWRAAADPTTAPALGTYLVRTFARALGGDAEMTTGAGRTRVAVHLPQHEGEWEV